MSRNVLQLAVVQVKTRPDCWNSHPRSLKRTAFLCCVCHSRELGPVSTVSKISMATFHNFCPHLGVYPSLASETEAWDAAHQWGLRVQQQLSGPAKPHETHNCQVTTFDIKAQVMVPQAKKDNLEIDSRNTLEVGQGKEQILLWSLWKECNPADTSVLILLDPFRLWPPEL